MFTFANTRRKRLKDGNILKKNLLFQVREKALNAMASGPGCQDTHLFSCLYILDANRSMTGFPNLSTTF